MDAGCSTDSFIGTAPPSGKYGVDYATDYVPLCNGWVVYGDLTNNKIQAVNAVYRTVGTSYPLGYAPADMAYDPVNQYLWIILKSQSSVARVNLATGSVALIALPGVGVHVAATENGYAFVALHYTYPNTTTISYLNGTSASIAVNFSIGYFGEALIACDSTGTAFYVAPDITIGGYTEAWAFNTSTYTATLTASVDGYSANGKELELSPDGNHLAFVCGGGNTSGINPIYSIFDLTASNISAYSGSWFTGKYPLSADFSPDSKNITTTNGSDLQVFGVSSHAASKTTWVGATAGIVNGPPYNTYELTRTRFSQGGWIVYGLDIPTYNTPAPSTIVWETFP